VVNGTSEADWDQVLKLCQQHDDMLLPAFGLHPWYVKERSSEWTKRLKHLLEAVPQSSIGECGLDLWMQNADIAEQVKILQVHISLSRELGKTLTIHCLRAWQELWHCLRDSAPLPPFLLHSFSGPTAMIPSLVKMGAYFSVSGYFLHPRKIKTLQAFAAIPIERILVESDAPDMAPPIEWQGRYHRDGYHHPADLPSCVDAIAKLHSLPLDDCAAICWDNTHRWLSKSFTADL
jgi:TatD DNase family protein